MNRVFRDNQGELSVDDLGLADQLKQALATYTESGGQGSPIWDTWCVTRRTFCDRRMSLLRLITVLNSLTA